jgi:hypothetical protein
MHGNVLKGTPVRFESDPLGWFRMHINPHLFGREVFNFNLPVVDLVLDEEVFHFDVFCTLTTGPLTIGLQ